MTAPLDLEAIKRRVALCTGEQNVRPMPGYPTIARTTEPGRIFYRSQSADIDAHLDRRDLIAEVERLTAWRPMESAPKDGTDVLCLCEGIGVRVLYWHTHFEGWTLAGSDANDYEPIGWLPTPPESP